MSKLQNNTQNQHFVSQAEQRFNCINPDETDRRKQRIFAFTVVDKDRFVTSLDKENGVLLRENLAFNDLFTLVVTGSLRLNLEACFQRYEQNVTIHTRQLLAKLNTPGADIKAEVISLFASKFLNLLRNPYQVKKVLNLLGDGLARFEPTDPSLLQAYREISVPKPHHDLILQTFGLDFESYRRWMRSLFLMLAVDRDGHPMLNYIIKGMLEGSMGRIRVFRYSNAFACLLSDRGLNDLSSLDKADASIIWDFNLTSRAFCRVTLTNLELAAVHALPFVPPEISRAIGRGMRPEIAVDVRQDDLKMLVAYNRNTIRHCYREVYCAVRNPYGVHIARRTRSGCWHTNSPGQRASTRSLALARLLQRDES